MASLVGQSERIAGYQSAPSERLKSIATVSDLCGVPAFDRYAIC